MFYSFMDELEKIAADIDWKEFEKDLRKKSFQNSVLKNPGADKKLKKYVRNVGGYLTSKEIIAKVPSRTTDKVYKIKKLPSGRLACGCRDWQYYHSVRNSDCAHIKALGKEKKAESLELFAKGLNFAHTFNKPRRKKDHGKARAGS